MNRKLMSQAKFGVRPGSLRNAQSWLLSPQQARGAAAVNALTATTQRTVLLQSISMDSDQAGGTVNANGLRVAGLSLNCGDQPIPIGVFSPTAGGTAKAHTNIGIAINQNTSVSVDAVQSAAGAFGYSIGLLPLEGQIPSTEAQSDFYNYIVGCGTTGVVAAGANGQCQAVVLRGCWLGLVMATNQLGTAVIPDTDIVLTDLTVNGISMLAGGAAQQIPLSQISPAQSNTDDFILDYWVEANSIITFSFSNLSGAANMDVGAAIFCKPYKAPPASASAVAHAAHAKRTGKFKRG